MPIGRLQEMRYLEDVSHVDVVPLAYIADGGALRIGDDRLDFRELLLVTATNQSSAFLYAPRKSFGAALDRGTADALLALLPKEVASDTQS